MQATLDELAMLLGLRDIQIFVLEKQVAELQRQLAALTPQPEVAPLKAVP